MEAFVFSTVPFVFDSVTLKRLSSDESSNSEAAFLLADLISSLAKIITKIYSIQEYKIYLSITYNFDGTSDTKYFII